jgi:HlyD family secretion protein
LIDPIVMKHSAPIPVPLQHRLRDVRMRLVPAAVFVSALVIIAFLWKDYVAAPTMTGQVESIQSSVSSYKPGILSQLEVARFQKVKAGEPIAQILITDPKILTASLAVIQAEIEVLRVGMQPVTTQQRNAMNYDRLQLDWMDQRAQLAIAKVNLQQAEAELRREEELYKEKIVSQSTLELAQTAKASFQAEIEERTKLVEELEQNSKLLQAKDGNMAKVTEDPLHASIAAQEAKLRLTEAELSPITLTAPVDGVVSMVYHRSGEAITAGEPVISIAATNSARIVGYLRPPIACEPQVGMKVQVRTRNPQRQVGLASVIEVGAQLEPVATALQSPAKLPTADLGLPLGISMPTGLNIRPGELVDLTLSPTAH